MKTKKLLKNSNVQKFGTHITVAKVNVDNEGASAVKYSVVSIPMLIVFKDGKEHARIIGYRPKEDILAVL